MRKIKEIKGDLVSLFKEGNFDAIVHGCNCQGIMGAGIAKRIADEFPYVLKTDRKTEKVPTKLGSFSYAKFTQGIIINLYTQFLPGSNFEYAALIKGLYRLNKHFAGKHIAFPQIGCGIGGGDWEIVKDLINNLLHDVEVTIVYYDTGENSLGDNNTNEV